MSRTADNVIFFDLLGTLCALVLWHPYVRGPLASLADRLGALYERVASALLRRPAAAGV